MMRTSHSDNPITKERRERFLSRQSVIEMRARERAVALLDPGTLPRAARPVRSAGIPLASTSGNRARVG